MYIDYTRYPRPESIAFFERAISDHHITEHLEKLDEYLYRIYRYQKTTFDVLVTNHYILGLADYYELIDEYPNIQGIVTISNWNDYTHQAKVAAREYHVGIFVMKELLGALNWDEPYKYVKKDDKGNDLFYGRNE